MSYVRQRLERKALPALYLLDIVSTLYWSSVTQVLYVAVAFMWLVPDRRIERSLHGRGAHVPGGDPHGRETAHDADASR